MSRFSRPHRRERIETANMSLPFGLRGVSPGLTAGSGLKQPHAQAIAAGLKVSPGLTAGSGLKPPD